MFKGDICCLSLLRSRNSLFLNNLIKKLKEKMSIKSIKCLIILTLLVLSVQLFSSLPPNPPFDPNNVKEVVNDPNNSNSAVAIVLDWYTHYNVYVCQNGSWGTGAWGGGGQWGTDEVKDIGASWDDSGLILRVKLLDVTSNTFFIFTGVWSQDKIPPNAPFDLNNVMDLVKDPNNSNSVAVLVSENSYWDEYVCQNGSWGTGAWGGYDQWGTDKISSIDATWNSDGSVDVLSAVDESSNLKFTLISGTWSKSEILSLKITNLGYDPMDINKYPNHTSGLNVYKVSMSGLALTENDLYKNGSNGISYTISDDKDDFKEEVYPLAGFTYMDDPINGTALLKPRPVSFNWVGPIPNGTNKIIVKQNIKNGDKPYSIQINDCVLPKNTLWESLNLGNYTDYSIKMCTFPNSTSSGEIFNNGVCAVPITVKISKDGKVLPQNDPIYDYLSFAYNVAGDSNFSNNDFLLGCDISSKGQARFAILSSDSVDITTSGLNKWVKYGVPSNSVDKVYYLFSNDDGGLKHINAVLLFPKVSPKYMSTSMIINSKTILNSYAENKVGNSLEISLVPLGQPTLFGVYNSLSNPLNNDNKVLYPDYIFDDKANAVYALPPIGVTNITNISDEYNWAKMKEGIIFTPYSATGNTSPLTASSYKFDFFNKMLITYYSNNFLCNSLSTFVYADLPYYSTYFHDFLKQQLNLVIFDCFGNCTMKEAITSSSDPISKLNVINKYQYAQSLVKISNNSAIPIVFNDNNSESQSNTYNSNLPFKGQGGIYLGPNAKDTFYSNSASGCFNSDQSFLKISNDSISGSTLLGNDLFTNTLTALPRTPDENYRAVPFCYFKITTTSTKAYNRLLLGNSNDASYINSWKICFDPKNQVGLIGGYYGLLMNAVGGGIPGSYFNLNTCVSEKIPNFPNDPTYTGDGDYVYGGATLESVYQGFDEYTLNGFLTFN